MFIVERDHTAELKDGTKTYTYYSIESRYQDSKTKKIKSKTLARLGANPTPEDLIKTIEENSLQDNRKDLLRSFYDKVDNYKSEYETFEKFLNSLDESEGAYKFYEEQHLQKFLIQNFEEFFNNLELYPDEKEAKEYSLGDIGWADIMARDKETGELVIIELKDGTVTEDAVGQILKYIEVAESQESENNVGAIILGEKFSASFEAAFNRIDEHIDCREYSLDFDIAKT